MALIEVENLVKEFRVFDRREGLKGAVLDLFRRRYRRLRAVAGVSFRIGEGEIVGYIGPNGAGKSTTIKMLTGILEPTSGRVRVAGLVPHSDRREFCRRIGVVFGQRTQLWWDIAVVESLRLLARMYDVPKPVLEERIARLDEILGIGPLLHTPVRKLSLGQRMRCDLAASLLHAPPILFLDEPTIGLDVVAKDSVRTFLHDVNRRFGTTILLTTHDLRDIEALCRRVIVIDHGRILFDGALEEMKRRHAGTIHVQFDVVGEARIVDLERILPPPEFLIEREGPHRFRVSFERRLHTPAEVVRRVMERFEVADLLVEESSIEEVVKRIYASSAAGERRSPVGWS